MDNSLFVIMFFKSPDMFFWSKVWRNDFISKNKNSKGQTHNSLQISVGRPNLRLWSLESQAYLGSHLVNFIIWFQNETSKRCLSSVHYLS